MAMFLLIVCFLVLLFCLFWQGSFLYACIIGSPVVYSSKQAVLDCFKLAGTNKGDLVIDLGCGNGGTLITSVKKFGARGIGVDRSFFCYLHSKINVFISGESKNIQIIWGNFSKAEEYLKKADVVYLYLLNTALEKIEKWFFESIGEKTKVVSLAFSFKNHAPISESETINLGKTTKIRLYKK